VKSKGGAVIDRVSLMDITGRVVLREDLGVLSKTIHAEHLRSGMYLMNIESNGQTMTKRISIR
jgi:hypothetical protein